MPTRSPSRNPLTPSPSRSIVPTISWPGTRGTSIFGSSLSTTWRSVRHTPHARTCTSTWPAPTPGTSRSTASTVPAPRLVSAIESMAGLPYKEVGRHGPADGDDEPSDIARVELSRERRGHVAAKGRANCHGQPILPRDLARDDERCEGEAVDGDAQERLQPVHLVNVRHAGQRHRRQHHDAHAAAEVTAVGRNQKLHDDHAEESGTPCRAVLEWMRWSRRRRRRPELLSKRKRRRSDEHQA